MDWTEILIALITAVIGPAILLLSNSGIKYLKAKAEAVSNAEARNLLQNSLYELESAVGIAVTEVQETFVKAIRESGNFNAEIGKEALKKSINRVKEIGSDLALQVVDDATGNLDAWITSQIEAYIASLKTIA